MSELASLGDANCRRALVVMMSSDSGARLCKRIAISALYLSIPLRPVNDVAAVI
jgi:hypothetical protein